MTANCPICGRVFDKSKTNEVCPVCKAQYEDDFEKVRSFLYENPNKNVIEVAEATGVSISIIKRFLQHDRLVAVSNSGNAPASCQLCGKPVDSGVYCESCRRVFDPDGVGRRR